MSESFRDKLRSINFGRAEKRGPKVTVDQHDHHKVVVTEHFNDRVDVNVVGETVHLKTKAKVQS